MSNFSNTFIMSYKTILVLVLFYFKKCGVVYIISRNNSYTKEQLKSVYTIAIFAAILLVMFNLVLIFSPRLVSIYLNALINLVLLVKLQQCKWSFS